MGLMNQASKTEAGTPKYELKRLNIAQLYPDPQNTTVYSVENIEELADAIEIAGGVLHNLVVRAADETGRYMIISGERRWTACKMLVDEKHLEQFGEVNCLVENEHDQDTLDLMLLLTNSTARQLSDAEKMRQAERMTDILNRMKEQQGLEGRVRDIVGKIEGAVSLNHVTIVKHEEREDEPGWPDRMAKIEEHRKQDYLNGLQAKVGKYGYDSLEPCEACHLSTQCMKCCESCREVNEVCGMAQSCGRKIKLNAGKWEVAEVDEYGQETYQTGSGGYKSWINFTIKAVTDKTESGRYCLTYTVVEHGNEAGWVFLKDTYDTKEDALRAAAMEVAKTGTTKASVLKDNGYIDEIPLEAIEADKAARAKAEEQEAIDRAARQEENERQIVAARYIRNVLEEHLRVIGSDDMTLRERLQKEIKRYDDEIDHRRDRKFD